MAKIADNRKVAFTHIAYLQEVEGVKKLVMKAPLYWQYDVNKLFVGKKYGITVEEYKPSRSKEQLKYYWVLVGLIATHTGYTPEETHFFIKKMVFGSKTVTIVGVVTEVVVSIADSARFPKGEMVVLIQKAIEICAELEIKVPTKEELGYIEG